MTETMDGGCLCGAVRFSVTGPVQRMVECHCTDCQKVSGGAAAYLVGVPRDDFVVTTGAVAGFAVNGESGKPVTRYFCRDCGTPLYSVPESFGGIVFVIVGAFDSDPGFESQAAVWVGSAPAWHSVPEGPATFQQGSKRSC